MRVRRRVGGVRREKGKGVSAGSSLHRLFLELLRHLERGIVLMVDDVPSVLLVLVFSLLLETVRVGGV